MDFDNMTLNEKAEMLWSKATFLTTANYYNRMVNLYLMDGKYYELWYHAGGNIIEKIIPMENSKLFSKYFREN